MSGNKSLNVVLDIGKTNVKLIFFNKNNKVVKSYNTKQKPSKKFGIKVLNSAEIYGGLCKNKVHGEKISFR